MTSTREITVVLPNFVIAGAAKAGTSSLTSMVAQHPDVFVPIRKEAHHFMHQGVPAAYAGPGDDDLNSLAVPTWQGYQDLFEPGGGFRAVGEASVFYMTSAPAMEEMKRLLGPVRVVVSLRDPAKRAFSAYSHLVMQNRERLTFAEGLAAEQSRIEAGWEPLWWYRSLGLYSEQVENLHRVFGADSVLLLRFDDFQRDAPAQLRRVFSFLDVDPGFEPDTSARLLRTGQPRSWVLQRLFLAERGPVRRVLRRAMPASARRRLGQSARDANLRRVTPPQDVLSELRTFYREDVQRLEALTSWDLAAWR